MKIDDLKPGDTFGWWTVPEPEEAKRARAPRNATRAIFCHCDLCDECDVPGTMFHIERTNRDSPSNDAWRIKDIEFQVCRRCLRGLAAKCKPPL